MIDLLIAHGVLAVPTFVYVIYAIPMRGKHGPFAAATLLFIVLFAGLTICMFGSTFPLMIVRPLSVSPVPQQSRTGYALTTPVRPKAYIESPAAYGSAQIPGMKRRTIVPCHFIFASTTFGRGEFQVKDQCIQRINITGNELPGTRI